MTPCSSFNIFDRFFFENDFNRRPNQIDFISVANARRHDGSQLGFGVSSAGKCEAICTPESTVATFAILSQFEVTCADPNAISCAPASSLNFPTRCLAPYDLSMNGTCNIGCSGPTYALNAICVECTDVNAAACSPSISLGW